MPRPKRTPSNDADRSTQSVSFDNALGVGSGSGGAPSALRDSPACVMDSHDAADYANKDLSFVVNESLRLHPSFAPNCDYDDIVKKADKVNEDMRDRYCSLKSLLLRARVFFSENIKNLTVFAVNILVGVGYPRLYGC